MPGPTLRIGQLADRLEVSPHVLRVWERRYGLFEPIRTSAGYRLYGETDERRARAVLRLQAAGVATAEAARLALLEVPLAPPDALTQEGSEEVVQAALAAVDDFDGPSLSRALHEVAGLPLPVLVDGVVLPVLRGLDSLADDGPPTVAHTRLGAEGLRELLLSRAREPGSGDGPLVWLACPEREAHDLPLLTFGLLLAERDLRVRFLGANTPLPDLGQAAGQRRPDAIVLALTRRGAFRSQHEDLARLARSVPVWIAGRAASPSLATATGAHHLSQDVVSAAADFDPTGRATA